MYLQRMTFIDLTNCKLGNFLTLVIKKSGI